MKSWTVARVARTSRAIWLLNLVAGCTQGSRFEPVAADSGLAPSTIDAGTRMDASDAGVPASGAFPPDTGASTRASGAGGMGASSAGSAAAGTERDTTYERVELPHFSFFVTSQRALQELSGSADGFGGDLRFGKADGLAGADEICRQIAETSLRGSSTKGWRAFLSVTADARGNPVHAIDRIGDGPWYDRLGRLVAANKRDLVRPRPSGADPAIINDLPNEDGVPNHAPDGPPLDNHDVLTGTDNHGNLYSTEWSSTCHDWTSAIAADGKPRVGHSWPRSGAGGGAHGAGDDSVDNWMSALDEAGCAAGSNLLETGPPDPSKPTVGSGGGYGGIYCFALSP